MARCFTAAGEAPVEYGPWGIQLGNGVLSQPTDVLFFAAGPSAEMHGLYGFLAPAAPLAQGNGHGH
jgi:hypothetical protein